MPPALNPEQAAAVAHRQGPLLVLAGAGTGKTRVVTERIAGLLHDGIPPKHILAVTFTNKAAGELRERLHRTVRGDARKQLKQLIAATFHSLSVRLLRRDPEALGYRPGFTICDQGEQVSLIRKAASTVQGAKRHDPKDLLFRIGQWKNEGVDHEKARRGAFEEDDLVAAAVYRRYQEALRRLNAFDFDDLLGQSLRLLQQHGEALTYWRRRFRYILVDEFQDTNTIQFALIQLLAAPRNNLCVVGDDDQSIYAWRGARTEHILEFPHRYPDATVVTLEQNYRSTNHILRAANAVIARNTDRRPKTLRSALGDGEPVRVLEAPDQFDEAQRVVDDLRGRLARGAGEGASAATPGDFAILLRANQQGRHFEEELRNARLPYVVIGGQKFFDREEARDVLAYLAVVASPDADAALLRIANTPARGLGDKSLDALVRWATDSGRPLIAAFAEAESAGLSGKPAAAAKALAASFDGWRASARTEEGLPFLVGDILRGIGYEDELAHRHDDPLKAAERYQYAMDVGESLRNFLRRRREAATNADGTPSAAVPVDGADDDDGHNDASSGWALLSRFVQDAALWGDDDNGKDDHAARHAIKLITGHSAKGLEFPHVYVPGVEEGLWPHRHSAEAETGVAEERRLFYVAMTRARKTLTLSRCLARSSRGKNAPREPSRFLKDIPSELLRTEAAYLSEDELGAWFARMRDGAAAPDDDSMQS